MFTHVSRVILVNDILADSKPTLHYQCWIWVPDAVEGNQGLYGCTNLGKN